MNMILKKVQFSGNPIGKPTLSDSVNSLLKEQIINWELARKNYGDLNRIRVKKIDFDHFELNIQFNPERIVSSSAKTDSRSIEKRKCFLCPSNLPGEQKGIIRGNFVILVNPFPIFPKHLTIPKLDHTPQRITGNFRSMLEISRDLPDFHLFYNGPKCGASAPDHMHFQAGNKGFMPIENEYPELIADHSEILIQNEIITVFAVRNYLRKFISIESNNKEQTEKVFQQLYSILEERGQPEESLLNLLCQYKDNRWIVVVFPRDQHRPYQYFEEGELNILLSPASVDFGGYCITPLEKDFKKITKEDLEDIFMQVSINDEDFNKLASRLKHNK